VREVLYKQGSYEMVERARNDPRVREVFDLYRKISTISTDFPEAPLWLQGDAREHHHPLGKIEAWKLYITQSDVLDSVICGAAEVYQELTGKSPRTADTGSGKRLFDTFVAELFQAEGLDPPTTYKIKQATRKQQ
jgi:hypothetical protein